LFNFWEIVDGNGWLWYVNVVGDCVKLVIVRLWPDREYSDLVHLYSVWHIISLLLLIIIWLVRHDNRSDNGLPNVGFKRPDGRIYAFWVLTPCALYMEMTLCHKRNYDGDRKKYNPKLVWQHLRQYYMAWAAWPMRESANHIGAGMHWVDCMVLLFCFSFHLMIPVSTSNL